MVRSASIDFWFSIDSTFLTERHGREPGHRFVNYDGAELPW